MIESKKYPIVTPIMACIFIIVQRVLFSGTAIPQYDQNGTRFYLYSVALGLVAVGGNLLALYMGYHGKKSVGTKPLAKFANFYLLYVFGTLVLNLSLASFSLNIRDYWTILFPISQNIFPFATAYLLLFLLSPYLYEYLDRLKNEQIKWTMSLLTFFLIALPTFFGKDIWGMASGNSILLLIYFYLVGYAIYRFNFLPRYHLKFIQVAFGIVILASLVLLMTHISLFLNKGTSTATRFNVPWSLFSVYYSISLFIFLENVNKRFSLLRLNFNVLSTSLLVVQILVNWPIVTRLVSEKFVQTEVKSGTVWAKQIIYLTIAYLIVALLSSCVVLLLQKIPLYRKIEQNLRVENFSQLKLKLSKLWNWVCAYRRLFYSALFFYLFTIMQMLLIADYGSKDAALRSIFTVVINRQAPVFLNVIVIMTFLMLVILLINRFWYAFAFTLVIDLVLTIATVLKIKYRLEPILPADLAFLNSISEILDMLNPVILIISVIGLVLVGIYSWILQKRLERTYHLKINIKKRVLGIVSILVFFSGVFFVNHQNSLPNLVFKLFRIDSQFYNQRRGTQINGPVIQFLSNIDVKIMEEPSGYSQENIKKIMAKYDAEAKKINSERQDWQKEQTVIFTLSESFSDPSRLKDITLNNNPFPFITQLSKETTSGLMLSSGYGGGTANMEWQSLTGMDLSNLGATLPVPYTQLVNKQKKTPTFLNLFDEAVAIHPFSANTYSRLNVFEKFGFDKFHYIGSPDGLNYTQKIEANPYISDEAAYQETVDAINATEGKTQFIQLSTMQNHMPYNNYYKEDTFDFEGAGVSESNRNQMKTYLQGLNYTDQATQKFIEEIDKIEKPITIVWYGDHLPGIYKEQDLAKYPLLYRETDYFVYNNKYAQQQRKLPNYSLVSPYMFSSLALEQANIKVTPFYALLTAVTNNLPATIIDPNSGSQNVQNGKKVFASDQNKTTEEKDLTKEQKELLHDYELIQYDLVAGKQYSADWAEKKSELIGNKNVI